MPRRELSVITGLRPVGRQVIDRWRRIARRVRQLV